jgi:hypothetical protein
MKNKNPLRFYSDGMENMALYNVTVSSAVPGYLPKESLCRADRTDTKVQFPDGEEGVGCPCK